MNIQRQNHNIKHSLPKHAKSDNAEVYSSDIELVVDFMKLALIFNDKKSDKSGHDKLEIINLETDILRLMPVAQSERMASVYKILKKILKKQTIIFETMHGTYIDNREKDQAYHRACVKMISEEDKSSRHPQFMSKLVSKDDRYVILLFDIKCPACQRIKPIWDNFRNTVKNSQFTVLEYDALEKNIPIFEKFNVSHVPTIVKLDLTVSAKITELNEQITQQSLNNFAVFD
jgi:thiol-disulfide isomerase/thioredoxin